MLKRLVALVMCVLLPMTALAEGWMTGTDQDAATENVTTDTVYEVADGCCVLAGLCNESGSKAKALVVKVQK